MDKDTLKHLYIQMYKLTQAACKRDCYRVSGKIGNCCSKEYCEMAKNIAKKNWGLELEYENYRKYIPFMSKSGCVVQPWLRPLCTVHVCEKSLMMNPKFKERYMKLRDQIDELEFKLHSKNSDE